MPHNHPGAGLCLFVFQNLVNRHLPAVCCAAPVKVWLVCTFKRTHICVFNLQGRPERGMSLDGTLRQRVRTLIEQENIRVSIV